MCNGQGLDVEASLIWLLGVRSDLDGEGAGSIM